MVTVHSRSYEQLVLGYLAVLRKEDGALIGRCGLMGLVVESAAPMAARAVALEAQPHPHEYAEHRSPVPTVVGC